MVTLGPAMLRLRAKAFLCISGVRMASRDWVEGFRSTASGRDVINGLAATILLGTFVSAIWAIIEKKLKFFAYTIQSCAAKDLL